MRGAEEEEKGMVKALILGSDSCIAFRRLQEKNNGVSGGGRSQQLICVTHAVNVRL